MRIRGLLVLLPLLVGVTRSQAAVPAGKLTITFIDVGQGEAILIDNGSGFEVLIDGGRKSTGEIVLDYLRRTAVDEIEVVLATHADSDHIGGLIKVIEAEDIVIGSIYFNGYPGDTLTWAEFSTAAANDGLALIPAQYPDSFSWGGSSFKVLNPGPGLIDPEQNEASIVLDVDFGHFSTLLTADIDVSVETLLLSRGDDLDAEILKVAHHGSKHSTSVLFLQEISPNETIISVGPNPYGHPAPEIVSRIMQLGMRVWRTDHMGSIQVISDGNDYIMFPRLVYLPLSFRNLFPP